MAFSLTKTRKDIEDLVKQVFNGVDVYRQAVADDTILQHLSDGSVKPYVTYEVAHIQQEGRTSFAGPMNDDYVIPLRLKIVVAANEKEWGIPLGEELYDTGVRGILGHTFEWSGSVRARNYGLVNYPIKKSDGTPAAMVFPLNFAVPCVQLQEWDESSSS